MKYIVQREVTVDIAAPAQDVVVKLGNVARIIRDHLKLHSGMTPDLARIARLLEHYDLQTWLEENQSALEQADGASPFKD